MTSSLAVQLFSQTTNEEGSSEDQKSLVMAYEPAESSYCYGNGLKHLSDSSGRYISAYPRSELFGKQFCSENDFRLLGKVGEGSYGKVWKAIHIRTGIKVAIKELFARSATNYETLRREECIQHSLNSPLIVRHFCTISAKEGVAFVLEFVPGDTLFYSRKRSLGPLRYTNEIAAQLILALQYIHDHHVIYRDLKPENIMYNPETGSIKIIDFGLALQLSGPSSVVRGAVGTQVFMAPEVINYGSSYSFSADWYSLGLVIYELIAGFNPFDEISAASLNQEINSGFKCRLLDKRACNLVGWLTHRQSYQRWGITEESRRQIKNHPWLRDVDWDQWSRTRHERLQPRRRRRISISTRPSRYTANVIRKIDSRLTLLQDGSEPRQTTEPGENFRLFRTGEHCLDNGLFEITK